MKNKKVAFIFSYHFIYFTHFFIFYLFVFKKNETSDTSDLNDTSNLNNEFVCNLSQQTIKEMNDTLAKNDLVPQNITGLNSNFVHDLDKSLADDCHFIDKNNETKDITTELGKIDKYYWNIDYVPGDSKTFRQSVYFCFKLNPTKKEKLKKIENLKEFIDFYWVYKHNNAKQLIVEKDSRFLSSTQNCYFAKRGKYYEDINKRSNYFRI